MCFELTLVRTVTFIFCLITFTFLLTLVSAYTAYCILIVVSDTAAGSDEVRWPGDFFLDWISQSVWLLIHVAILFIPFGFIIRCLGDSFWSNYPVFRIFIMIVLWLWLAFPIGLLSSLSAKSPFVIVRPIIVYDLLCIFPSTALFYIVTAVGACGVVLLWYLSESYEWPFLIPVAAVASASGTLIYARLLGRMGQLIIRLRQPHPQQKRPLKKSKSKSRENIQITDPWQTPSVKESKQKSKNCDNEPGPQLPVEGYSLSDEPPCRPPKFKLIEGSPFLDVKIMPASPPQPTGESPSKLPRMFAEEATDDIRVMPDDPAEQDTRPRLDATPSAFEMRLLQRDEPYLPPFPLLNGVYTFPWYGTSLRAFWTLVIGWLALGLCLFQLITLAQH